MKHFIVTYIRLVSSGDSFCLRHISSFYDEESFDLSEIRDLTRDTSLEINLNGFSSAYEDCRGMPQFEYPGPINVFESLKELHFDTIDSPDLMYQSRDRVNLFESLEDSRIRPQDMAESFEFGSEFFYGNNQERDDPLYPQIDQKYLEISIPAVEETNVLQEDKNNVFNFIKNQLLQNFNEKSKDISDEPGKNYSESIDIMDKSKEIYDNLPHNLAPVASEIDGKTSSISTYSEIIKEDFSNAGNHLNRKDNTDNDLKENIEKEEEGEKEEEKEDFEKVDDKYNIKIAKLLEDDGRRFYMNDACLTHSRTRFTEVFESQFDANIYLNTRNDNDLLDTDEVVDIRIESHIPGLKAREYVINMPKLVIKTLPFSINIIHDEDILKEGNKRYNNEDVHNNKSDDDDDEIDDEKIEDVGNKKVFHSSKSYYSKAKHPTTFIKNTYAVTFADLFEDERPSSVDSETQTHIDMNNYDEYKKSRVKRERKSNGMPVVSIWTQTSDFDSSSSSESMFPNLQRNIDVVPSACSSIDFDDFIKKRSNHDSVARQIDQCMTSDKEIKGAILLSLKPFHEIYNSEKRFRTSSLAEDDSTDHTRENISDINWKNKKGNDIGQFSDCEVTTDNESDLDQLLEGSDSVFINDSGIEQSYDFSIYEENLGNDTDFELDELASYDEDDSPYSEASFHFDSTSLSNSSLDLDTISDYENNAEKEHLTIEPQTIAVSEQYLSTLKVVSTLFASTFSLLEKENGFGKSKRKKYAFEMELDNQIRNFRNSKYPSTPKESDGKRVSFNNFVKYNFISKEGKLICYSTNGENGEECRPFAVYISEEIFV